jgi:Ca-activated chloride channel family protein
MKLRTVALLSFAGMVSTSATVYSLAPAPHKAPIGAVPEVGEALPAVDPPTASFEAGTTLRVGGRVGHPRIRQGSNGDTFVLLEVGAGDQGAARAGSSHLAIVIDRSGSMKGDRIRNAIAGAVEAVDRLGDGDAVSVVTFDTQTTTVVPTTFLAPESRERVKAEIRKIGLGGDTCISCGLDAGLGELRQLTGKVDRMILLSDGEATAGVRDVAGFRAIAEGARAAGVSITTLGVGVSYNQKVMGEIALRSGGEHYFVENTSSLERIFQAEADKLRATVARDAIASIDLGEDVELRSVADRTFTRSDRQVIVPLGNFSRGEQKTVLLSVRVPTRNAGRTRVAGVSLGYSDVVRGERTRCEGRLEVEVGAEQAEVDGVVGGRVQRTRTADTLLEVNDLLEKGKVEEARRTLASQQAELEAAHVRSKGAAPAKRKGDVDNDFAAQAGSLSAAASALAAPRPRPAAPRHNQEMANPFRR